MRGFLAECFPDANGPVLSMETCFFENTPDRSPIIDHLPGHEGFWIIGGFSGHGFKYASVIGQIARDLVLRKSTGFNLEPFHLGRF
jgi:N-methyl-L-tryptophan oxidase